MSYTFGDAFQLMWYQCPCGHKERIWNSRDGVTPAGMGCPSCGEPTLHHIRAPLHKDVLAPDHRLYPGQGFWRDGTLEDALAIMNARLDKCKGTQYEATPERREAVLNAVRNNETYEFQPGWPMFDRHPRI